MNQEEKDALLKDEFFLDKLSEATGRPKEELRAEIANFSMDAAILHRDIVLSFLATVDSARKTLKVCKKLIELPEEQLKFKPKMIGEISMACIMLLELSETAYKSILNAAKLTQAAEATYEHAFKDTNREGDTTH